MCLHVKTKIADNSRILSIVALKTDRVLGIKLFRTTCWVILILKQYITSKVWEKLPGTYSFHLNYWLLIDSRRRGISVRTSEATTEPARLRRMFPHPESHRWPWLVSVNHKTK